MENVLESDYAEKVSSLQKEFKKLNSNLDEYIQRQDIYRFLDKKLGTEFNRAKLEEIYQSVEKDSDGKITINGFITAYIESGEELKRKIESAKNTQEGFERQYEECIKKAEEEKILEKLTTHGIIHNSTLHITIIKATGLEQREQSAYIEINFENHKISRSKAVSGGRNLDWKEKINFDVVNPNSSLKFTIYRKQEDGDFFEGLAIVRLSDLSDQNLHDVILDLLDENEQISNGKLHLKIHWIHSKAKYFSMIAQKWYDNYVKEDEKIKDYEKEFLALYKPFSRLKTIFLLKPDEYDSTVVDIQPNSVINQHFQIMMNRAASKIGKQNNPSESFWFSITKTFCLVELLIAIAISFGRASFLDLLIPIIIFLWLEREPIREFISLRVMTIATFVSLVLDFIWIWNYHENWTNSELPDYEVDSTTRKFVFFMSCLNIVVKIILFMLCHMVSLQTNKSSNSLMQNDALGDGPMQENIGGSI